MHRLPLLALALIALPFTASQAATAPLMGASCVNEQVGTTRMDTDKSVIVACLYNDGASPESGQTWKAMSNSWEPVAQDTAPFDVNCRYKFTLQSGDVYYATHVTANTIQVGLVCGNLLVNATNKAYQDIWAATGGCGPAAVKAVYKLCQ